MGVLGRPRAIWVGPLQCEEAVGGRHQRAMVMKVAVAATLVGVKRELALALLVVQSDQPRQPREARERLGVGVGWEC